MFKFSFLIACFVATIFGQEGESEGGSQSPGSDRSNYFEYTFQSLLNFAYAPDQCSATDLTGTSYIMPTCVSNNEVEVSFYSNSDCTTLVQQLTYNSSDSDAFFCRGVDSYSVVTLGMEECSVTVYVAVSACVQHLTSSTSFYSYFSCSSQSANITVFNSTTCSSNKISTYQMSQSCGSADFTLMGSDIYGQVADCVIDTSSNNNSSESEDESGFVSTEGEEGRNNVGNTISFNKIVSFFVVIGSIAIASL